MIDVNSLTTNTPASAQQQLVSRLPDEALQILAREIVKEAGLAQDSERMAEIEQHRARFEYSKTLMLLYLALLASMGAVTALIENPQDLYLLYIAVAAGLVGLVVTNFATSIMPGVIGMPVFDRVTGFISVATSAWFSADVLLFVLFLYANI